MWEEHNVVQRQHYIDFLKEALGIIQILNNTNTADIALLKEKTEAVKNLFSEFKNENVTENLERFIYETLGNEPEELQNFFRVLYVLTDEQWFAAWHIDAILQHQLQNKGSYYLILQLKKQSDIVCFMLNRKRDSMDEWNMNQYFQTEMQNILDMHYTRVPVSERKQDFIVIVTTQLLEICHAPTRLVLEFCRIIEEYLKFKILLVCTLESIQKENLRKLGVKLICDLSHLDANGLYTMEYKQCKFDFYQLYLEEGTQKEQQKLMNLIYERKPLCVWQFAGIPSYASAMKQFTSFYYMKMNQGYPAVSADLVINYYQDSAKYHSNELMLLQEQGVPVADMIFSFSMRSSKGLLSRRQFQIPEDGFCLGVAGNRLKNECTDAFIQVLSNVMKMEKDVQVVFIGFTEQEFIDYVKKNINVENKCFFLGHQDNPEEALALIDLYVDLPHQGGGYMGTLALSEGKPVLCLKGGDVSAKAGEEFCCNSLEEYESEIIRYKNNAEYYKMKSEAARSRADSIMVSDEMLAKLIDSTIKAGLNVCRNN